MLALARLWEAAPGSNLSLGHVFTYGERLRIRITRTKKAIPVPS